MKDRLTFIIAQRLTSIRHADLILVVENGQVVQRGVHDELIACAGPYQDIYRIQMEDQGQVRRQIEATDQLAQQGA